MVVLALDGNLRIRGDISNVLSNVRANIHEINTVMIDLNSDHEMRKLAETPTATPKTTKEKEKVAGSSNEMVGFYAAIVFSFFLVMIMIVFCLVFGRKKVMKEGYLRYRALEAPYSWNQVYCVIMEDGSLTAYETEEKINELPFEQSLDDRLQVVVSTQEGHFNVICKDHMHQFQVLEMKKQVKVWTKAFETHAQPIPVSSITSSDAVAENPADVENPVLMDHSRPVSAAASAAASTAASQAASAAESAAAELATTKQTEEQPKIKNVHGINIRQN